MSEEHYLYVGRVIAKDNEPGSNYFTSRRFVLCLARHLSSLDQILTISTLLQADESMHI